MYVGSIYVHAVRFYQWFFYVSRPPWAPTIKSTSEGEIAEAG